MKIQGAKKIHYDSGPNMTPLVDVVMVILIFLMLTGSFGGITHFLFAAMPLSKEGVGGRNDLGIPKTADLTIAIKHSAQDPTVKAYLDGRAYPIPDPSIAEEKGNEAKGLEDALVSAREKLIASGAAKKEDVQVIIAPNPDIKQMIVIKVYEAAYASEFTKIGFKMPPK